MAERIVTRLERVRYETADAAIDTFIQDTRDIEAAARALLGAAERAVNYNMAGGTIVTVKTTVHEVMTIVNAARAVRTAAEALKYEALTGEDVGKRLGALRASIPPVAGV